MISIIIPIYNGEKFIETCLSAIFNQKYSDLEIILIEDGSSDKSYLICKEWEEKDERIKLYKKKNGGVSSARNFGLEKATGEFISFIDIDDEINEYFFENFIREFNNSECDIVISNYYIFNKNKKYIGVNEFNNENYQTELLRNKGIMGFVFNKVYKKSVISNIRFDNSIKIYEDLLFNIQIAKKKPKYKYIDLPLYYYNQVETSAMHTTFYKDISRFYANIKIIDILEEIKEFKLAFERKYYYIIDINEANVNCKNIVDKYLKDKYEVYMDYLIRSSDDYKINVKLFFIKNFYCIYRQFKIIKQYIFNKENNK